MVPTPHSLASWMTACPTALFAPFWITHCFFFPLDTELGSSGLSGTKSDSMRQAVGGLMASVAACRK